MVKLVEMDEKVTLNTLAVVRSLTMPFGSLQSTLNGLLIVLSSGRAWPADLPQYHDVSSPLQESSSSRDLCGLTHLQQGKNILIDRSFNRVICGKQCFVLYVFFLSFFLSVVTS